MATHPTYIICLETDEHELYQVLRWFDEEWPYVRNKFGGVVSGIWDTSPEDEFIDEWTRQSVQYIDRARAFGLDTERGRQALAKAATTMLAFAASAVRIHGPLPKGGHASGEPTSS